MERQYAPFLRLRLEFGRAVTYVPNKDEPRYRWYRYKEAFSRQLVVNLLQEWQLPPGVLVFDPFAGCGTTLLACQELGYPSLGVDILPLAVFITGVKLRRDYQADELEAAAEYLLSLPFQDNGKQLPRVHIIDLAFSEETQRRLVFYRDAILERFSPPARDFLLLALLSILEQVSYTSKDGQFLRLVSRRPKPVEEALREQLHKMITDLRREVFLLAGQPLAASRVLEGDARALPLDNSYDGTVGAVITSPPYLNRYDYSRTYALELCMGFVNSFEELRDVRHRLLRSHIESRPAPTDAVRLPALDEILQQLAIKKLNNERIPIMIKGYFEDMNLALKELSRLLSPGGRVALVVANARFEGEMVPVDLLLSEIAASHGLITEEIRVTRYKGNSSQQMNKYGRVPVRESIALWRKANA
ncbi:MAG: DNA methyltransferase [Anaerolineae bacterium]|nr:DNA methyltransferase [Anaerolineae bacterium]